MDYLFCLPPLFVAVDPFGVIPIFIGITANQTRSQRRRTLLAAVLLAGGLGLAFFAAGQHVLSALAVGVNDFRIAGGILLLLIAVKEIFSPKASALGPEADGDFLERALVPLAIPLIVGPAVLTTGLVLVGRYGFVAPAAALVTVLAGVMALLLCAQWLMAKVRLGIWAALSKIICILLAAYGVAFIRDGLHGVLLAWGVVAQGP